MKKHFDEKCFQDVTTGKTVTWVTFLHEPECDGDWKDFSEVVKLEYPGKEYRRVLVGGLEGLEVRVEINSPVKTKKV
jgi:hypothetical protein